MKKIYVASSWRNDRQQDVVEALRVAGNLVYDFKKPSEYDRGFSWSEIDDNWRVWTTKEYIGFLTHPVAERGFMLDFNAMKWADVCVLVMPCGRSAHTEAGWMAGAGKKVLVLMEQTAEPELMYKVFDCIATSVGELVKMINNE